VVCPVSLLITVVIDYFAWQQFHALLTESDTQSYILWGNFVDIPQHHCKNIPLLDSRNDWSVVNEEAIEMAQFCMILVATLPVISDL